jgi:hypothetical protein
MAPNPKRVTTRLKSPAKKGIILTTTKMANPISKGIRPIAFSTHAGAVRFKTSQPMR